MNKLDIEVIQNKAFETATQLRKRRTRFDFVKIPYLEDIHSSREVVVEEEVEKTYLFSLIKRKYKVPVKKTVDEVNHRLNYQRKHIDGWILKSFWEHEEINGSRGWRLTKSDYWFYILKKDGQIAKGRIAYSIERNSDRIHNLEITSPYSEVVISYDTSSFFNSSIKDLDYECAERWKVNNWKKDPSLRISLIGNYPRVKEYSDLAASTSFSEGLAYRRHSDGYGIITALDSLLSKKESADKSHYRKKDRHSNKSVCQENNISNENIEYSAIGHSVEKNSAFSDVEELYNIIAIVDEPQAEELVAIVDITRAQERVTLVNETYAHAVGGKLVAVVDELRADKLVYVQLDMRW